MSLTLSPRTFRLAAAALVASVSLTASSQAFALGSTSSTLAPADSLSGKTIPRIDALQMFGADNELRRDLTGAPVADNSNQLVSNLAKQVNDHWGGVAAFNDAKFSNAAYTVRPGLPRRDVIWDNCQNKSYTPDALYKESAGAHFVKVPIPTGAMPAAGTDGQLSVYDPATDQLWEFWKANKQADGWHACWGGRIDNVSKNPGYFEAPMGVQASGLISAGTSISIREAKRAKIQHAIGLAVISAAHWSEISWPAQRSDGWSPAKTPGAIRQGQRFRLDPSLDVDALGLHPIARGVALAAQRYGFIITDTAGAVGISTQSGAHIEVNRGADPWEGLRGTTPRYAVLKDFPWSDLQAMPLHYGQR